MSLEFEPTDWLPTSAKEVKALGWESIDVILFSGDAYIDHPSFGIAVIGRLLQKLGLRVAIVPQPNWQDDLRDFRKLGKPNLFFGVSAGNMDSMVNHYTANKRLRSEDAYTPGGKSGHRPDHACIAYTKILKQLYPETPVIIGGIEASLRRLSHYDYWGDSLKPSILFESGADLLIYGMAEKPLKELAAQLRLGIQLNSIRNIRQTVYLQNISEPLIEASGYGTIRLNSFENCIKDKKAYAENFKIFEEESNKMYASRLIEQVENKLAIVNPPFAELTQEEIDEPYNLPYTRLPHPRYRDKGEIPAFEMIKNSINIHRGCFGGCSFCTISAHQGKFVQSRSENSILSEISKQIDTPGFTGTITDLGGPSANMYKMKGKNQEVCAKCKKPSCIFPKVCPNLNTDHSPMTGLYQKVSNMKGVNHVYIGSGIRYDLIYGPKESRLKKNATEYLLQLVRHHVSGRLKVAPEHTSDKVLNLMRKPPFIMFKRFNSDFERMSNEAGKKQKLIPYFISSHPNSTLADMAELAAETRQLNFKLEQVQDFTPTPMTLSSCLYYTGFDPYTGEKIFSARSPEEKKLQQSFFFWYKPEMKQEIKKMLEKIGRRDLTNKIFGR
jgi:uncharacterized radical SAM protein YgiQ